MNTQEINDRNIKMLSSKNLMLETKYRGVQNRSLIELAIKECERRRDIAKKPTEWLINDSKANALKWVLSATVDEEILLQRDTYYGKEQSIRKR